MMLNAFISYSRKDKKYKNELLNYLVSLKREGLINSWSDSSVLIGSDWEKEIKSLIKLSDIIIFLVSPDFINSDYIFDHEVKEALKTSKVVVPLIIRPCDWYALPISRYQAFPADGKTISQSANRNESYSKFTSLLRKKINEINEGRESQKIIEERLKSSLIQLHKLINKVIEVMKNLPMIIESEGTDNSRLYLNTKSDSDMIVALTLDFVTVRNDVFKHLKLLNEEDDQNIELIFEQIYSYVTMARVGQNITEKGWKQLFELELTKLYSIIISKTIKNEKTDSLDKRRL